MTRKRKSKSTSEGDLASRFTIEGDPSNLPDAFYDALARLLLDCAESEKAAAPVKKKERSKSRPPKSKLKRPNAGSAG